MYDNAVFNLIACL